MLKSAAFLGLGLGLIGALAVVVPASTASPPGQLVARARPSTPTCREHVVLNDADNGTSVCVAVGSDVTIMLKSAAGASWSTPTTTGNALGPGRGMPTPYGFVGWQFPANAAGATEIQAIRTPALTYRVTVSVR
jgi:predicted secreted protein